MRAVGNGGLDWNQVDQSYVSNTQVPPLHYCTDRQHRALGGTLTKSHARLPVKLPAGLVRDWGRGNSIDTSGIYDSHAHRRNCPVIFPEGILQAPQFPYDVGI